MYKMRVHDFQLVLSLVWHIQPVGLECAPKRVDQGVRSNPTGWMCQTILSWQYDGQLLIEQINQIAKSNKSVVKGLSQCRVSDHFNNY